MRQGAKFVHVEEAHRGEKQLVNFIGRSVNFSVESNVFTLEGHLH